MVNIPDREYNIAIRTVKDLGQAIRAARKKAGLSQGELASLTGVGTRFVSDLENGKSTVQMEKALRLIESLGLRLTLRPKVFGRD